MAIYNTKSTKNTDEYVGIFNKDGSKLLAFINVAKNVNQEDLVEALVAKGINVEIRTPNYDDVEIDL